MRDFVVFYVNGRRFEIRGEAAFSSLTDFLRGDLQLTGTKVVCAEGDCGACTVLVGRPENGQLRYQTVDACIQFLYQLDCRHIVTVEGLRPTANRTTAGSDLHPIQQAMVDGHGSQCGYCTPGFVMALMGIRERVGRVSDPSGTIAMATKKSTRQCPGRVGDPSYDGMDTALRTALTGNLCRCTGYVSILEAAIAAASKELCIEDIYPSKEIVADFTTHEPIPVSLESQGPRTRVFFGARTLADGLEFKARLPNAMIVSGGTELGVLRNKKAMEPAALLSLTHVAGLGDITETVDALVIGANTTWTQIEDFAATEWPELHRIVVRFGSPQIRNVATLVANVAHGSPIADSLPFLSVMDAELDVVGRAGPRRVNINNFYRGYKIKDLSADEIITHVRIPKQAPGELLKLYKVSRRNDLDIATFGAAIRVRRVGDNIARADVAFAGVAPTVVRLPRTETFLQGQPFSESIFAEAGRRARAEIQPISDVRGSRDFRWRLAENIFLKFFFECSDAGQTKDFVPANGKAT